MSEIIRRPIPFGIFSTGHGMMIVNIKDSKIYHMPDGVFEGGVGANLLLSSVCEPEEIALGIRMLQARRRHFGDGVAVIDGGANIGVHAIEWSKAMHGWGTLLAFEAQERVAYALAGNIAINNCFNASMRHAALGAEVGSIDVPHLDYTRNASFGNFEIRPSSVDDPIGQDVDYAKENCYQVPMVTIDSLALARVDFIKVDVEGMEIDVLRGAQATLKRHKPILHVEHVKSDLQELLAFLRNFGYEIFDTKFNLLCVHASDPTLAEVNG